MTAGPILIEGRNLAMREGTGIATYARNLVSTISALGYSADVLFDVDFPLSRHRAEWNEIKLYDQTGRPPQRRGFRDGLKRLGELAAAAPFGVAASEIADSRAIIDAGLLPGLSGFEKRQAVERLFLRADRHLLRYRRRMPVRPIRQPSLFHATHPAAISVSGCPNIYTIHDLVPLRLPHTTLDNKRVHLKALRELVRSADRIVTVSEHSRQDIVRFLGADESRVVNTYQAVSLPPSLTERSEEERRHELAAFGLEPQDYFLFLGAIEPKKNVDRLIDAYLSSGSQRPLVLVGKLGWGYEAILSKLERSRRHGVERPVLGQKVIHLSYLPFHQVVSLIIGARALLFPSLYEGFGLPALEAMLVGTPVLAANTSSLPEVVGEAGLLVDPLDPIAMAKAIRTLDEDGDLRAEFAKRGPLQATLFSPERYTARVSTLYGELI